MKNANQIVGIFFRLLRNASNIKSNVRDCVNYGDGAETDLIDLNFKLDFVLMLNQAMGGSCPMSKIQSGELEASHFECWLLVNKCSYFFMSQINVLIGAIHSKMII